MINSKKVVELNREYLERTKFEVKYSSPCCGLDDIFKDYRKKYKGSKEYNVSRILFKAIIDSCNQKVVDLIIDDTYKFVAPNSIGNMFIGKIRAGKKYLDTTYDHFKSDKIKRIEKKAISNLMNNDRFRMYIRWERKTCRIKGRSLYTFSPTDMIRKRLKKINATKDSYKNYPTFRVLIGKNKNRISSFKNRNLELYNQLPDGI